MPIPIFKTWNDIITNPNNCLLNARLYNNNDLNFYRCKPKPRYKVIKLFRGVRRYKIIPIH